MLSTTIDVTPGLPSRVELLVTGKSVIVLKFEVPVPDSVLLTVTTSPIRTVVLGCVHLGPATVPTGHEDVFEPLFVQKDETTPLTLNTKVPLLNDNESVVVLL